MLHKKKQEEEKNGVNPVTAAVAGAVLGAGVAVAGAVALKDEKTQKKVKQVLSDVKDQAVDYLNTVKEQTSEQQKKVAGKIEDGKKEADHVVATAKKIELEAGKKTASATKKQTHT